MDIKLIFKIMFIFAITGIGAFSMRVNELYLSLVCMGIIALYAFFLLLGN